MNKQLIMGVLGLFLLGACQQKSAEEGHAHNHETEAHEEHHHNHEGHDHAHEGHTHEHEGHNHEHETAKGHSNEGDGDEIILSPEKARAAGVEVGEVKRGSFRQVLKSGGELEAAQGNESVVVATVAGVVRLGRQAVEGVSVNKGTPLLTLSSRHIGQGDAAERARTTYENAEREYRRMKALAEERIVSERELTPVRQAYEEARIAYEALQGGQTSDGQQVTSPLSGYVKELMVKEGDYVEVGQPLFSVTQTRRLRLRADVPARHAAALRQVQTAHFCTPATGQVYALEQLNGRLIATGRATASGSRYIPVTFELDNRGDLLPGQPVEVSLLGATQEGVIVLPRTALTEEQGSYFVYLQLDEEGYRKQLVEVSADNGLEVLIASGLKEGERVVTRGAYQVKLAGASNAIPAHSHEH